MWKCRVISNQFFHLRLFAAETLETSVDEGIATPEVPAVDGPTAAPPVAPTGQTGIQAGRTIGCDGFSGTR